MKTKILEFFNPTKNRKRKLCSYIDLKNEINCTKPLEKS